MSAFISSIVGLDRARGDTRYGLPQERRHARTSRADNEPYLVTHDAPLEQILR
jgi:hypothetical protein